MEEAEKGRRGTAVPILNLSAKWGMGDECHTPATASERSPAMNLRRGWMQKMKSLATTGFRTPNRAAHSSSLYQLHCPRPHNNNYYNNNFMLHLYYLSCSEVSTQFYTLRK
jgi:hypothetical protein